MKHTLDSVISSLIKKGVLFVDGRTRTLSLNVIERKDDEIKIVQRKVSISGKLIVLNNAHNIGNGSCGKIDYLCNKHGYRLYGLEVLQQINLLT